ncbi:MAG TPA: GNAT family N-acetyltransferase, partial [Saprospiraceae bacterium]|nr:GNAT family N-acetyltransferase [Saprospiraceae bacterium]
MLPATLMLPTAPGSAVLSAAAAYQHRIFRTIAAAGADWDAAAPAGNLFLQRAYLSVLEANPPLGMRFAYLVFYAIGRPVGVALCQIKHFKGDDNIHESEHDSGKEVCFFNGLAKWLKRRVAGMVAADILICGNMLLTGEHGYHFDYSRISPAAALDVLERSLVDVLCHMEQQGVKMPVILIKDLAPQHRDQGQELVQRGFVEFDIQPNMVMDLPFGSFEEYLAAMSTKYRTRAKRAFKKGEAVVRRELTLAEVQHLLPRIYALYRDIATNAGFNMVDLNEQYLLALKRDLGEQFRIFGYYLDAELLAFYTTIQNGEELEAHFLGYDKQHNHDLQLYQNILYDIVRLGIDSCCSHIVFARTALEIKSTVGATARDLWCYLRHQNSLANRFAGTVLDYLKPVEQWQPRHPFKGD